MRLKDDARPTSSSTHCEVFPFLRWAGGKRQIVRKLLQYLPRDIDKRVYREPFLGAGCLFFALHPERAYLSDANEHLVRCFEQVRDSPELVHAYLCRHVRKTCESYYYEVRDRYNSARFSAAQAARFIYLNKTCFNGLFRVNVNGNFNVPYGWKEPPAIPSKEELNRASKVLHGADLRILSFEDALENTSTGDFVYLDPPYPPLNGTSFFTHYTPTRFGPSDHELLAKAVYQLNRKGCLFMMTNADLPSVRELYKGFTIFALPVIRYVSCKNIRRRVGELVITNYQGRSVPQSRSRRQNPIGVRESKN